jgi:hypothetical protein
VLQGNITTRFSMSLNNKNIIIQHIICILDKMETIKCNILALLYTILLYSIAYRVYRYILDTYTIIQTTTLVYLYF